MSTATAAPASLEVVSCQIDKHTGVVVISAKTPQLLMDSQARDLAIKAATAAGLSRAGTSQLEPPYPVDKDGVTDDALIFSRRTGIVAYHRKFNLLGAL